MSIALIPASTRFTVHLADLATSCMILATLVLAGGYVFGASGLLIFPGVAYTGWSTVACLGLLSLVTLMRRGESGVFSIFLGRGIGGRILRVFTPLVMVMPFLREGVRSYFLRSDRMPENYATAMLASLAAVASFALLLIVAWRIDKMETEIHNLSLRDELTGLYNLRGFSVLAEQALRLAYRSGLPFSVLFVDVDELKKINDTLGHRIGSEFLVDTAEILKATFRETDVIGRVGGDEFAVAGQFGPTAISLAADRLREGASERGGDSGDRPVLSISVGYATCPEDTRMSLEELLEAADQEMYQEKRRKKMPDN